MSTSIQDAFDLPILEDLLKQKPDEEVTGEDVAITDEMADEHQEMIDNLGNGMVPREVVEERQARDHEISTDKIHKDAIQHAKDLMDLGYNIDTRSAGKMFEVAAGMMKIALDAKNSKRDAQLKNKKLGLDSRKLDIMERQIKGGPAQGEILEGNSVVVVEDRNEIIKQLRAENKK